MEENKKGDLLLIIVIVVLVLETGYLVYDKAIRKENTQVDNSQVKVNDNTTSGSFSNSINDYKEVKINNLNTKISKLDFSNKTISTSGVDDEVPFSISISPNKEVKITHSYANLSYSVNIENAISVGSGFSVQGSGSAVFYILTSDGSVYKIEDDMNNVNSNKSYTGVPKNIGVKGATQMTVTDNFSLDDDAVTSSPTVYIKTSDNKLLTDENLLVSDEIVSVVEANLNN